MEFGKLILGILGPVCLCIGYADTAITDWSLTLPNEETVIDSYVIEPVLPVEEDEHHEHLMSTPAVAENLAPGTTYAVVAASTDGASNIATYTLTTATAGDATFTISTAGVISLVSGTLDFETNSTIALVVVAVDDATPATSATVTLMFNVTDVNEAPDFASTLTGAVAYDGSQAGTSVATVTATDPESQTVVQYTIASGDANSDFTIGSTRNWSDQR